MPRHTGKEDKRTTHLGDSSEARVVCCLYLASAICYPGNRNYYPRLTFHRTALAKFQKHIAFSWISFEPSIGLGLSLPLFWALFSGLTKTRTRIGTHDHALIESMALSENHLGLYGTHGLAFFRFEQLCFAQRGCEKPSPALQASPCLPLRVTSVLNIRMAPRGREVHKWNRLKFASVSVSFNIFEMSYGTISISFKFHFNFNYFDREKCRGCVRTYRLVGSRS